MSALISNPALKSLLRGILVWAPLWLLTTIIFGALGVLYAFGVKQDVYVASQAILVRDEATGAVMRLGRFQSQAELKAAQEIILEMAKSHHVIREALQSVGEPPSIAKWINLDAIPYLNAIRSSESEYPSNAEIEEAAKQLIQVHAPSGIAFGSSEVIYVDTRSTLSEHAVALNKAICDALETRLQNLRKVRADGVLDELIFARDLARKSLGSCTERLHSMELEAGFDLSDLRGMTDSISSGATTKSELENLKTEIRLVESSKQSLLADREMLDRASQDPKSIIVAPASYLNAHPGLRRMREGLVDAQIENASIRGRYTEEHPATKASDFAQKEIVQRFADELKASLLAIDTDLALNEKKLTRLNELRSDAETRLRKLAESRATYANLITEVKSKTHLLETAEKDLAEAEAARDSSTSTSLLTRLDEPTVSDKPIGPGKTTLTALSGIAGLVFGLGIVFAITPIDFGPTYGRRSDDRITGRRSADFGGDYPRQPVEQPAQQQVASMAGAGVSFSQSQDVEVASKPRPRPAPPIIPAPAKTKPETLSAEDVDAAFRELARLSLRKPESREEEIAVQSKIHEIKSILEAFGHKTDQEVLERYGWTKPRKNK